MRFPRVRRAACHRACGRLCFGLAGFALGNLRAAAVFAAEQTPFSESATLSPHAFSWGGYIQALGAVFLLLAFLWFMLWLLRSPDMPLPVGFTIRLQGDMARSILGIGIPSAMENSVFQLGRIVVVSMISLSGTVQIAANAVANNLDGLAIIPGQAYELAMIAVVGRCIGARDIPQARYYTRRMMKGSYLSVGGVSLAMLAGLPLLLGLYEISDATWQLSWLLVVIHLTMGILIWPASFVLPCALRAANDVKFPMWVSILSMAIWRLGFSYLLAVRLGWGAVGVWIAMVVDWICRTICFAGRWASGRWEHFDKDDKEKETVCD